MAASGGLGCSSNSSGATDAGSEAREPSPDAGQSADAPLGSVDASNASTDAGGAQDSAPADGGRGAETGSSTSSSNTIPWNGGNFYLYGINYPWLTYGTDFGSGGFGHLANPDQVKTDMATFG